MSSGRLIYLIGPSGCGKDSLLQYARARIPASASVRFVRRYITRPADAGGEVHFALTPDQFESHRRRGAFAMAWSSHGLRYGIGRDIEDALAQGHAAVVNGSRAYLPQAAADFPQLLPVLIEVRAEILLSRLRQRGREPEAGIAQRLAAGRARSEAVAHPRLLRIDNNGDMALAGDQLCRLILRGYL